MNQIFHQSKIEMKRCKTIFGRFPGMLLQNQGHFKILLDQRRGMVVLRAVKLKLNRYQPCIQPNLIFRGSKIIYVLNGSKVLNFQFKLILTSIGEFSHRKWLANF